MVRTLALTATVALGVVATPGLAAAALLIGPVAVLAVGWWIALGVATRGRPSEALVRVRTREFLPGGEDDPFGGEPVDRGDRFGD
jgi:hypothetical protein